MNRTIISLLVPPAAVVRYGHARYTAAPIAVFWLTGLVGIFYGSSGGMLADWEATRWFIVGLGFTLWAISAVWARLVIFGVDEDMDNHRTGTLDRRITPQADEVDPFKEIGGAHGNLHL